MNFIQCYPSVFLKKVISEERTKIKKMSEQEIKEIGFELTKQYKHDQFNTNRYQKGILEVEFTYENKKLVTVDLTMEEINCLPITKNELQQLNKILNK